MNGILFLGRLDAAAEAAIAAVRRAHPAAAWTVVVTRQGEAEAVRRTGARESLPDKPGGSRLAALRALRARRFDVAVVLWCGRPGAARLSTQGLLCGARRYEVFLPDAGLVPLRVIDRRIWSSVWRGLRRGPCAPDLLIAGLFWLWDRTIGRLLTRRLVGRAARRVRARMATAAADRPTAAVPPAPPEALRASKPRG